MPPKLIPSICVCIAPLAETVHKKSELLLVIWLAMAEGGGDLSVVVFVPFEVITWVDSETIGSAAFAINGKTIATQKTATINPAIKLFLSLSDIR
tara:strand:- start:3909 stop:4193 length:285 start_codon:yes stop_codon:yes gene_type:complete